MYSLLNKPTKKSCYSSYSFNRQILPMPVSESKAKPPEPQKSYNNTETLFPQKKEKTKHEQIMEYLNEYKKAERMVIINFYTGGGAYKTGMMDALYAGLLSKNPSIR